MTYVYPGGAPNTHVQSFEATQSLIVSFSRNPDKFQLPRYVKYVPVENQTDLYLQLDFDNPVRVIGDGEDSIWPDGDDAPSGADTNDGFVWKSYIAQRHAQPFRMGNIAAQQADWDIIATQGHSAASRAMTLRTKKVLDLLTNSGNYGGNTDSATDLGGGLWGAATSSNLYIKKALMAAVSAIVKATNAAVQMKDLLLVLSPDLAMAMSETDEIHNYTKSSPAAEIVLEGQDRRDNFGLPRFLYGLETCVEDAVLNSNKKGAASQTKNYIMPENDAIIVSRPGGLEGVLGLSSFSTVSLFFVEELNTETKADEWNRVTRGRVTDNYDVQMTAAPAGYLITNTLS